MSWFTPSGEPMDWSRSGNSLMCLLAAVPRSDLQDEPNHHLLILLNAGEAQKFVVPKVARTLNWWQFIDTVAAPPKDIYPELDGPAPPADWVVELESRSLACYVARDEV